MYIILYNYILIIALKVMPLSLFTVAKYSHHYLALSEQHLNHLEMQAAARQKCTKINRERIPRI